MAAGTSAAAPGRASSTARARSASALQSQLTLWGALIAAIMLVGAGQMVLWPSSAARPSVPDAAMLATLKVSEPARHLRTSPAVENASHAVASPAAAVLAAPQAEETNAYADDAPLNSMDDINDDPAQALEPSWVPPPPDPRPARWGPEEPVHAADFCATKFPHMEETRTAPLSEFWPYDATAAADTECFPARLKYGKLLKPMNVCTYDPQVDNVVSKALHTSGKWMSHFEVEVITKVAACTPERPFFVDLGAGIGQASLIAASAGCIVIGFDPIKENLDRAYRTLADAGYSSVTYLYRNAILVEPQPQTYMAFIKNNPAASRTVEKDKNNPRWVPGVTLDDFFAWADRPMHPTEDRRMEARDVQMLMIFTEGHDSDSLFSAQVALQTGKIPFIHVPVHPRNSETCSITKCFSFMYQAGYKCYNDGGMWTFAQWHAYLSNPHSGQLIPYFIHEGAASAAQVKFADWYGDEK